MAFKHAMELAPDRVASAANLGALYARNGRYGDALPLLRSARVKDPKNPVLRANLGFALRDQGSVEARAGRLVEAVALFQEASRVIPDDTDMHRTFGLALCEQSEHEAVALHLERAAQLRPADESIRGLLERLRTDPGRVPALR